MYKRLEISQFRGINHAVLDDLGMFNILVGRNNAGKSSCLEAAHLVAAAPSRFKSALGEDALRQAALGTAHARTGWSRMTRAGSATASITAQRDDGRSDRLVIAKTPRDLDRYNAKVMADVSFDGGCRTILPRTPKLTDFAALSTAAGAPPIWPRSARPAPAGV